MVASQLESFRDVVGIGGAAFISRIKRMAGDGSRETEARGRLRDRVGFPEVVRAVEGVRGEPSEKWMGRHGDWGKWLVLKIARECTGMTLRELGAEVGGMDYAAVCTGLRRFDQRMKDNRTGNELTEISERMRQMLFFNHREHRGTEFASILIRHHHRVPNLSKCVATGR